MKVKAFLGYSSEDKKLAGNVKKHLEEFGFEVFLAHDDISPSSEWQKVIISELKICDVFIPLLTSDFTMSAFTDQEVGFALSRDIIILPLNVDTKPYGFIQKYQALSLDSADIRHSCLEIAKSVSENPVFADWIINGIIRTFGESHSFDQAARTARYILQFKALLNADYVNGILKLAASNAQIYNSFGARDTLELLIDSFKDQVKPSLIRKYRAKLKE